MLIGIISDTHDRLPAADAALRLFQARGVELVVHCGDWTTPDTLQAFLDIAARLKLPVRGVLGNNDRQVAEMLAVAGHAGDRVIVTEGYLEFRIDGHRLAAYHGHHKPTLARLLADTGHDALFLGHSHKPRDERLDNGLHVINPGSTAFAIPRRRGWQASVAVYDTASGKSELRYIEI